MKFQIISGQKRDLKRTFLLVLALGVCFTVFPETADGQRTRRTRSSVPQPVGTPVPSPTLTIPEIVRRADETNVEDPSLADQDITTGIDETEDVETLKKRIEDLKARLQTLESGSKSTDGADGREKKLLMSLDILSRAEQRAEALRRQLYEVIEKENTVKARIDQINFDMRPEMIERNVAMAGSLRPEALRDARQKSLESERNNLESLLTQIQANRARLEQSVERADMLVEKIRLRFEKEIDDALVEETITDQP
jgi:hypothetical protein